MSWRNACTEKNIGFTPTMGALHNGHLSLIKKSKAQCKITIVSIFVNELQFDPEEDFEEYPRTVEQDLEQLKQLKVDVVLIPQAAEMYTKEFSVVINELQISQKLEGASRPGFFSGVITIVSKLFNLVQPEKAYFGQKDIQQLQVIRKLVTDLNYQIEIVGCKTIREQNGLALSSRNQYLSNTQKQDAAILYNTLKLGARLYHAKINCSDIKKAMHKEIHANPKIKIDYLSIADYQSFEELNTNPISSPTIISGAIFLDKVRLIDNILIT
jgi:pantoate--beta-alanine ligase